MLWFINPQLGSRALCQHDVDTVGGSKGDRGKRCNHGVGSELESVLMGDGGQNEGRFHQGEVVADADPGAAAEGE